LSSLHPPTNGPAALSGQQQLPPNSRGTTAIAQPNNCVTVVHPNGADTKATYPSNCSPNPSRTIVQSPSNALDTKVVHNDNCAALVYSNGADTRVMHRL
jgi:hypothetical protein